MSAPQILPKEIRLSAPPTMPQARSYLFKQQSTQVQYSDNDTCQINLPRLQRSYLTNDSYLKFNLNVSFTPGLAGSTGNLPAFYCCLDTPGAYGIFNKIEVYDYLGSTILESTAGHSQLMSLLMDLDLNDNERRNHYNLIAGTAGGLTRFHYTSASIPIQLTMSGSNVNTDFLSGGTATSGYTWAGIAAGGTSVVLKIPKTQNSTFVGMKGDLINVVMQTNSPNANYFNTGGYVPLVQDPIIQTTNASDYYQVVYDAPQGQNTTGAVIGAGVPYATGTNGTVINFAKGVVSNDQSSQQLVLASPVSGEMLFAPPSTSKQTVTREYAIPLLSFLGLLSDKYAPLHNGYTIMLTLNPGSAFLGFSGPAGDESSIPSDISWNISNVYFESQVLELGPVAESLLLASTNGLPLVVPCKAFRNYVGNILSNQTTYRLDLNINVASLTDILWFMRQSSDLNNYRLRNFQRIRNFAQNWYFQYGSSILPQTQGITCSDSNVNVNSKGTNYTEAYCELMKSRHSLATGSFETTINRANYGIDVPGRFPDHPYLDTLIGTAYNPITAPASTEASVLNYFSLFEYGRFAAGLDLELVPGKSQNLISGLNTNGMNTSIYVTFAANAGVVNAQFDAFAEYDAFINIAPGLASTVSF